MPFYLTFLMKYKYRYVWANPEGIILELVRYTQVVKLQTNHTFQTETLKTIADSFYEFKNKLKQRKPNE